MTTLAGHGLAAMRGDRLIFAGLDLRAGPGELLVLTGRNGAGKSTLLRIVAGFVRPFAGSVTWNGIPVAEDREGFAAAMAYSGHLDGLKSALTARENVGLHARMRGHADADPMAALARLGMAELADLPVGYMSAGQRRRVALSRLLAVPARLWLLDEPLTALDRAGIDRLGEIVDAHRRDGGTVLAATHAALPGDPGRTLEVTPPDRTGDWDDDDDTEDAD
ncbi:MAG: heme ABC exporter ATP-binding protein CcmA [Pseudomonadota bacterium]|nr:heme ABC exporter ATP-binding protein CcmA [Pseudomonadota bacterium]